MANETWLSQEERKTHRMYLENIEKRFIKVKNPALKNELKLHLRNLRSELAFDKETRRKGKNEDY